MKKIKAFFDNGRSKKEEEKEQLRTGADSDYAAAVSKLPKLETLAVNMNIMDSLPLPGSKVQYTTPPPLQSKFIVMRKQWAPRTGRSGSLFLITRSGADHYFLKQKIVISKALKVFEFKHLNETIAIRIHSSRASLTACSNHCLYITVFSNGVKKIARIRIKGLLDPDWDFLLDPDLDSIEYESKTLVPGVPVLFTASVLL